MKQSIFNVLISFAVCCLIITVKSDHIPKHPIRIFSTDTIIVQKLIMPMDPEKDLFDVMKYYGIKYPYIVYAQAVLETGHFKSDNCVLNNNLFGLYDNKNKRYFKFSHWAESVKAYRSMIQYKFHENSNKPPNNERYYQFLEDLGYAKDTMYIHKLRNIVKRYE